MKNVILFTILILSTLWGCSSDKAEVGCRVSLREKKQPWQPKQDAVASILRNDYHYLGLLGWPGSYVPFFNQMYSYTDEICVIEDFTTCVIIEGDLEEARFRESVTQYAEQYNRIIHGFRLKRGLEKRAPNKSLQRTRPRALASLGPCGAPLSSSVGPNI
jgi:hypothetical protein